ncbi:Clavaminate synthase-like protein [Xylariaceae sp. FL1019]|nr:Clavaminate synthase-like protein [Xylariaceae sp. FL1019]
MASERLFKDIPPFPSNIPTAAISTLSLPTLRSGDTGTAHTLLTSAQELGLFRLDLHGDEVGEKLIEDIDSLFEASKVIMNLPPDVKNQYLHDPPRSFLGFKPRGASKIETMEPDRFEWFNIGQDGLTGSAPLQPLPEFMMEDLALFVSFLENSHDIIQLICRVLAVQLGLPPESFNSLQVPSKPSGTVIRFLKTFALPSEDLRTSMVQHTDFGTLTLLANVLGGLQTLAPGRSPKDQKDGAWLWVQPRPGCLIVNLGDAMAEWTGGVLRSNLHRIRYPPGEQRFLERHSVAILVRPERDSIMRNFMCKEKTDSLTAAEWEVKRFAALQHGEDHKKSTGGKTQAD